MFTLLAMGALTVAISNPAAADGPCTSPEYVTELGNCVTGLTDPSPDAFQAQQDADKDAAYAIEYAALIDQGGGGGGGGGGEFQMTSVQNLTIYKEGEGNGNKYWTCGPSATRNMVSAMWKSYYGSYHDLGEHQYEVWEDTTPAGTSAWNVKVTLNTHFGGMGHWRLHKATDRDDYLTHVAVNTLQFHQPVIVSIDTEFLSFWNGHHAGHFDFDYGWDSTDPAHRQIAIGEEWDPIFLFGSSSYGNPYGHHPNEALVNAFDAENNTSYHKMIT